VWFESNLNEKGSAKSTDACGGLIEAGHNINKLLDALSAGHNLKLPSEVNMNPNRKLGVGEIGSSEFRVYNV
jgi:hypothetical protein